MASLKQSLTVRANEIQDIMIGWRRYLHAHPELSFQEHNTSQFIQHWLTERNIPFTSGWAGNGIVADITVDPSKETFILLRADMDALPIQELNEVDYKSKNEGVMHACGHDVHMTCLLGAIELINEFKMYLQVNVKCIFQPGEEVLPGGASLMLKEKAFDTKLAKAILGLHVYPSLPAGMVGFKAGPYMASADEIYIEVNGKGGHGAMPHETIDPILIAAHLITNLQSVISRHKSPVIPGVLTVGHIQSVGGATNIIPDKVLLKGTFRAMDEDFRNSAHQYIKDICHHTGFAMGGDVRVEIVKGYPVLINNEALTHIAQSIATDYLSSEQVVTLPIRLTSEDFAWYTQEIKGCFFRLGTGNIEKGLSNGVHTPNFNVDEDCIPIGAGLLAYMALRYPYLQDLL